MVPKSQGPTSAILGLERTSPFDNDLNRMGTLGADPAAAAGLAADAPINA